MNDIFRTIEKHILAATGKTSSQILIENAEKEQAEVITKPAKKQAKPIKIKAITKPKAIALAAVSDDKRAVPNAILRSALFSVVGKGARKYNKNIEIATIDGATILFTGERLDQADLDVWEHLLHLAKDDVNKTLKVSSNAFLKAIGRATGNSQHVWLKGSIDRLINSTVKIISGRYSYTGHLVDHIFKDEITGLNIITLNPMLTNLYGSDGWTGIDFEQRQALKGKPLALWLHSFYSTHAKPFDYKIETLYQLCGSETKELREFKRIITAALPKLCEVTGWNCEIVGDKLQVKKPKLIK